MNKKFITKELMHNFICEFLGTKNIKVINGQYMFYGDIASYDNKLYVCIKTNNLSIPTEKYYVLLEERLYNIVFG